MAEPICGPSSLGAAILPALLKALGVPGHAAKAKASGAEFTALRDRFNVAATVDRALPLAEFRAAAATLFDRMDKARADHDAPPEFIFWMARWKVRSGHLEHDHRQFR